MSILPAPWTQEQIDAINAFQQLGFIHEFTCDVHSSTPLHACSSELYCPEPGCEYVQRWVHDFMADKAKHPVNPLARHP